LACAVLKEKSMKAARVHRYGPPDVIAVEDIDIPLPDKDQVLVRVSAAGVGPWDGWIRSGKSVLPQPLPLTLGSDLSGTVEAVGSGVTGFQLGDEVFGVTNTRFTDAYAEHALALASMIARKPRRPSHLEAASVPVVAVTALQMLFHHARIAPGQRVLVLGAAGGVGGYAVQLAHLAGAHVIGTIRGDEAEYLKGLGADEALAASALADQAVAPVDAVIDTVGGDAQERSFSHLKRGGVLISAVSQPDQDRANRHGVRATFILVKVATGPLTRIAGLLDEGQLTTCVGTVLPLAEARTAHEMLEGSRPHQRGKIVLAVGTP
jgi:NADPH:quinone reductase-like Zn-dependent oxidoreductase